MSKDIKVFVDFEESTTKNILLKTEYYVLKLSKTKNDLFAKKLQKQIDQRKDFVKDMYEFIIANMQYRKVKDREFATDNLRYEETLIALADEFIKHNNIKTTPSQKTIKETA